MIMKRFLSWLNTKLSRQSAIAEAEDEHIPVGVRARPKENIKKDYAVEVGFDPEVPGHFESRGPENNVLIQNRYADQAMATEPELSILSDSSLDANQSAGIDPYDSGCFDTSKMWKSPSHK